MNNTFLGWSAWPAVDHQCLKTEKFKRTCSDTPWTKLKFQQQTKLGWANLVYIHSCIKCYASSTSAITRQRSHKCCYCSWTLQLNILSFKKQCNWGNAEFPVAWSFYVKQMKTVFNRYRSHMAMLDAYLQQHKESPTRLHTWPILPLEHCLYPSNMIYTT